MYYYLTVGGFTIDSFTRVSLFKLSPILSLKLLTPMCVFLFFATSCKKFYGVFILLNFMLVYF
jgi:hypothetical protein